MLLLNEYGTYHKLSSGPVASWQEKAHWQDSFVKVTISVAQPDSERQVTHCSKVEQLRSEEATARKDPEMQGLLKLLIGKNVTA